MVFRFSLCRTAIFRFLIIGCRVVLFHSFVGLHKYSAFGGYCFSSFATFLFFLRLAVDRLWMWIRFCNFPMADTMCRGATTRRISFQHVCSLATSVTVSLNTATLLWRFYFFITCFPPSLSLSQNSHTQIFQALWVDDCIQENKKLRMIISKKLLHSFLVVISISSCISMVLFLVSPILNCTRLSIEFEGKKTETKWNERSKNKTINEHAHKKHLVWQNIA